MKRIKVAELTGYDRSYIDKSINDTYNLLSSSIVEIKTLTGRIDTEILQDILTNGGNTRNELESTMLSDIDKLSSVLMKDEFRGKLKNALVTFDKTASLMINSASSSSAIIPIENWVVEDNEIRVKDYDKLLEEAVSVYITGEKEIELYQRAKKLEKELNSLNETLQKYSVSTVRVLPQQQGLIFYDGKKYEIDEHLAAKIVKEVCRMK